MYKVYRKCTLYILFIIYDEFITDFAVKILGGMGGLDMEVPMFNYID